MKSLARCSQKVRFELRSTTVLSALSESSRLGTGLVIRFGTAGDRLGTEAFLHPWSRAFSDPRTHWHPLPLLCSNFSAPYATTTQLVVSFRFLGLQPLVLWNLQDICFVYDELTSPLRYVPGSPNPSFYVWKFQTSLRISESKSSYCLVA